MVSYGCIVYSCDHTDLSCATYMDHNTSEEVKYQEYDFSQGNQETQEEYRYKQLDIRVNKDIANIIELIKEEAQPDFLPCIDLEKLTAFGHSMGAMTAVHAAYTFSEDFKLCLAMDIYFKAMYQHIEGNDDYALTQPICISTSQTFHELSTDKYKSGYNCNATRNQFYMNCAEENGKRNYNLVIPDSTHTNQEDHRAYPCGIERPSWRGARVFRLFRLRGRSRRGAVASRGGGGLVPGAGHDAAGGQLQSHRDAADRRGHGGVRARALSRSGLEPGAYTRAPEGQWLHAGVSDDDLRARPRHRAGVQGGTEAGSGSGRSGLRVPADHAAQPRVMPRRCAGDPECVLCGEPDVCAVDQGGVRFSGGGAEVPA